MAFEQLTHINQDDFIPEIWSTDLYRHLNYNLVMTHCCTRIPFVGRAGDTVHYPTVSRLKTRARVIGEPVQYQSTTSNEWTLKVDQDKYVGFEVDKLLQLQSHTDLRRPYTEEAGLALARDIDNKILAERATIAGFKSQRNVIDSTDPLSYAQILAGVEVLEKNLVDTRGMKLIVSPSQKASLLTQKEFISADFNQGTGAGISRGFAGVISVLNIGVYVNNHLGLNSATGFVDGDEEDASAVEEPTPGYSTSAPYYPTQNPVYFGTTITPHPLSNYVNKFSALLVAPKWCALAMQQMPKIEGEYEMDRQSWKVLGTQIYGVEVYDPRYGVVLNSDDDGLV